MSANKTLYIQVFVVTCVVYASRVKPTSGERVGGGGAGGAGGAADGARLPGGGLVGTTLGLARDKPSRESTTNAHDWVWLGKLASLFNYQIH